MIYNDDEQAWGMPDRLSKTLLPAATALLAMVLVLAVCVLILTWPVHAQAIDTTFHCGPTTGKDNALSYCRLMAYNHSVKSDHAQLNKYTADCMKVCLGRMGVANPVLPDKPFDEPLKYKPEDQK